MERIKQLTNETQQGSPPMTIRREVELQSQRGILKIAVEELPDHCEYIIYLYVKSRALR